MLVIPDSVYFTILFLGLTLIGIGYFWRKQYSHFIRISGLILFTVHWCMWTYEYASYDNWFNAVFTAGAVLFLMFMAYHEFLDYKWQEETQSLKWFAGIICFGGFAYYLISYSPVVAAAVIYPVAWLTAGIMNALGLQPTGEVLTLGAIDYTTPSNVFVPIDPVKINIILACTAIQAIIIFASVIISTPVSRERKLKALAVTIGTIYPLNILRNVATIWLVGTGTMSFVMAHEYLGKIFSLIVLIILAYWTFIYLPEILDNIYGFIDLKYRKKPGMVVDGYVVVPEEVWEKSKPQVKKEDKKSKKSGK